MFKADAKSSKPAFVIVRPYLILEFMIVMDWTLI